MNVEARGEPVANGEAGSILQFVVRHPPGIGRRPRAVAPTEAG